MSCARIYCLIVLNGLTKTEIAQIQVTCYEMKKQKWVSGGLLSALDSSFVCYWSCPVLKIIYTRVYLVINLNTSNYQ